MKDIKVKGIKASDMKVQEMKGKQIKAQDVVKGIKASDIKANDIKISDIKANDIKGKGRVLHFVNAGEQDVAEVIISSGIHKAGPGDKAWEISYKISYGSGSAQNPLSLKKEFARAADAILVDAKNNEMSRLGKN